MAAQGRQYRHVNKRQRAITLEVQVCFFPLLKVEFVSTRAERWFDRRRNNTGAERCEIISATCFSP